jgi:hypothetical protein
MKGSWCVEWSLRVLGPAIAVIALASMPARYARAGSGCKTDGTQCATSSSCCSGECMKPTLHHGKAIFGVCCVPTTCAAEGTNCGTIPNGDWRRIYARLRHVRRARDVRWRGYSERLRDEHDDFDDNIHDHYDRLHASLLSRGWPLSALRRGLRNIDILRVQHVRVHLRRWFHLRRAMFRHGPVSRDELMHRSRHYRPDALRSRLWPFGSRRLDPRRHVCGGLHRGWVLTRAAAVCWAAPSETWRQDTSRR